MSKRSHRVQDQSNKSNEVAHFLCHRLNRLGRETCSRNPDEVTDSLCFCNFTENHDPRQIELPTNCEKLRPPFANVSDGLGRFEDSFFTAEGFDVWSKRTETFEQIGTFEG